MLGKTHRIGGFCFGIGTLDILGILGLAINPVTTVGYVAGSGLGSLIPDLDHQGSLLSNELKPISKVVSSTTKHRGATHYPSTCIVFGLVAHLLAQLLLKVNGFNLLSTILFAGVFSLAMTPLVNTLIKLVDIDMKIFNKYTSKFILFAIGVLFTLVLQEVAIDFAVSMLYGSVIGYASHLVLDLFTVGGIPAFGPVIKGKVHLTNFKTGNGIETFGILFSVVVAIVGLIKF